ncbi:histidine kinase N-terminal 7TM domain-containing protein [Natronorubrum sp. FCH18a]|uniref:histidine kinase N-terminal 7TM domain-containing protein n=1 Tax=Natronorubrum sp. FCH18a TaxID=3447018 RepID=UPI003F51327D
MIDPTSLIPIAYLCGGLLPLFLVPYSRTHGEKPGRTGLIVALVGLSIWTMAYGLALSASSYLTVLGLGSFVILGGQLAAFGYLLLAIEYTGLFELTPRFVGGVAAIPILVQFLTLTDPLHYHLWGTTASPVVNTAAAGPVGRLIVLSTLAIGTVAALLLVADAVTATGVRRRQSGALVAAGVPTLLITVVDIYVIDEYVYSILPFGVVTSAFVVAWALFRMDFLDVVPVGRKRIVEEMDDAAIVVDAEDRVVECNPAARRLSTLDRDYVGVSLEKFFGTVPDPICQFSGEDGVDTEVTITVDEERRHLHLKVSRLDDSRSTTAAGRLIVLRDITALKRREQALEQREAELEFLRQVLARVLRHNIRNDLTVVRGYAASIADEADGDTATMATKIVDTSDDLLATSQKARTIERVVDRDDTADTVDLSAMLDSLVREYRGTHSAATVSLDAPPECLLETDPWLESAFDILLENALDHHDGSHPTVEVSVDRATDRTTVTIDDDGPGIPRSELAVLEQGEETPLEHGSGIGLWIIHWIIDRSAASIRFDTGTDGTRVSIRIPT